MKNLFIRLVALLGAAMAVHGVSAQEPQKHEAELSVKGLTVPR